MYFCVFLLCVISGTIRKKAKCVFAWLAGSRSVVVFAWPPRGDTAPRLQPQILLIRATLLWAQKYDADVQI